MNRRLLASLTGLAGAMLTGLTPVAVALAQDWSGPEIGVQGGYGWGSTTGNLKPEGGSVVPYHFSPSGGLGGVHAGYNWQSGPVVYGIEADADGGILFKSFQDPAPGIAVDDRIYADASLRAKAGYAFDRFLVYGTAGGALADVSTRYSVGGLDFFPARSTRLGWTAGAGLAYVVTGNWEAGIEYRYTGLPSHSVTNAIFSDDNRLDYNAIRLSVTYRFAPPPPPPPMATPMP